MAGNPSTPPAAPTGVGVTVDEFQQLGIGYAGTAPLPTNVGLAVSYNLSTTLTDHSIGTAGHTIGTLASLSIQDPATFNATLDANGYPTINFVMGALTSQGNLYAAGTPASLSGTSPVTLALNHPYWVEVFIQGAASLNAGSTD